MLSKIIPTGKSVPLVGVNTLNKPPRQSQCFAIYGDFRLSTWDRDNLAKCDLSKWQNDLRHVCIAGSNPSKSAFARKDWFGFYCHRLVADKFQMAFKNIVERGLSQKIKTFGGCLNKRQMRGGKSWSMHSWGIALDLNVADNPFNSRKFTMSEDVVKCFEDVGFVWGGRWKSPIDAMHFQYATIN